MAKIESLSLPNLTNAAHFQHIKYILDLANNVPQLQGQRVAQERLSKLNEAFKEEDRCLMLSKQTDLTERITAADQVRDQQYSVYKQMVSAMRKMPDSHQQESAKTLWKHISDYKINTSMALDKQTAMMTNFIDDLNVKFSMEISTLNLQDIVRTMDEANQEVEEIVKKRALGTETGALRNARLATDKAYGDFTEAVDAVALIFEESEVLKFINDANAIVERTKSGMTRKSTTSATKPMGESEANA